MGMFSGEPLTRWKGSRIMMLEEDFYFIDRFNKKWIAPKCSELNGATIPQPLWSVIGSPYCGPYRRASIVHDVAVGEGNNPPVPYPERKAADRMFYEACRTDGCSKLFALELYIGVRLGTWASKHSSFNKCMAGFIEERAITRMESPEDQYIKMKFWGITEKSEYAIEDEDLDKVDRILNEELGDS